MSGFLDWKVYDILDGEGGKDVKVSGGVSLEFARAVALEEPEVLFDEEDFRLQVHVRIRTLPIRLG